MNFNDIIVTANDIYRRFISTTHDKFYNYIKSYVYKYPDFTYLITYSSNVEYKNKYLLMTKDSYISLNKVLDKLFNVLILYFDTFTGDIEISGNDIKSNRLVCKDKYIKYIIKFNTYDTTININVNGGVFRIIKIKFKYV